MDLPEDLEFFQILAEMMSSLPKVKSDIQVIVEELKRGSIMNWGNIRLLLSELYGYRYFCCSENCSSLASKKDEKCILSFLTFFDMHNCFDMSLIADVLELLIFKRSVPLLVHKHAKWMGVKNNRPTFMSTLEKTLVCAYKDIPSIVPPISDSTVMPVNRNFVEKLAITGQVDLLKLIISYGATLIVPQDIKKQTKVTVLLMRMIFETDRRHVSIFKQNLKAFFNERFQQKRLYFVTRILELYFNMGYSSTEEEEDDYIQFARIFISSTPEPIITIEELRTSLNKLCCGLVSNEEILSFLKTYKSYFPESLEPVRPRSLLHLSRFQVRESLRTARSYPHGVRSLCVPKKIQDYICFKDILCHPDKIM